MKKFGFILLAVCMTAAIAACGKKAAKETTAASAAAETTAVQTTEAASTAVPSSEALQANSVICTVQKSVDSKLSVETDDGKAMTFDVSKAEMDPAYTTLMQGDEVEIWYEGSEPVDGMAVLKVMMSTPFEYTSEEYNEDPSLYGQITSVDNSSVTVQFIDDGRSAASEVESGDAEAKPENGASYKFSRAAYSTVVSKAGAKAGVNVLISYVGDLNSNPVCVRMVTDDIMDEDASDVYEITGTIEKVTDRYIFLTAGDSHLILTSEDDAVISQAAANVGKTINASYGGSLRCRVIDIDAITVK